MLINLLATACFVLAEAVDFNVHLPKATDDDSEFRFEPWLRGMAPIVAGAFETGLRGDSAAAEAGGARSKVSVSNNSPFVPFPRMLFMPAPPPNTTAVISLPPATTAKPRTAGGKMARNLNFPRFFSLPAASSPVSSSTKFAKLSSTPRNSQSTEDRLMATHQFVAPPNPTHASVAHVSVPSHRLLNDILVIPSHRRFYILAILPIHESLNHQGFQCGRVDVNGFVRLAAFLEALQKANEGRILSDGGLQIGAVIVDSCSSDLRTVANLYELLSGTNIERSDLVAVIRDDSANMPNVDEFVANLQLPTINTFFTANKQDRTTGSLPAEDDAISAILDLFVHTQSTCVSLIFDDQHASVAKSLPKLANARGICVEEQLQVRGKSNVGLAQSAVRKLLLTEARVIVVLTGDRAWLDLMQALRNEMVIAGRFLFATIASERWTTSKDFLDAWPHFDQLLIAVTNERPQEPYYLSQITQSFPNMPFPQKWLRDFWTTAFRCHLDGEISPGTEQFSRTCSSQQVLDVAAVSPDHNIAPITLAVHAVAFGIRRLIDSACPGALLHTLSDCLSEPSSAFFVALKSVQFTHPLGGGFQFVINSTTGFRDTTLVVKRVRVSSGILGMEELGQWSANYGLNYTANVDLVMEERDGRQTRLQSQCPKSFCIGRQSPSQTSRGVPPTFRAGLNDLPTLIFAGVAALWTFVCLMCMYEWLVSTRHDPYKACTMYTFAGLAMLSLVSMFFMMTPSPATCGIRRVFLSFALAVVFAPIMVKTIFIWRNDMLMASAIANGGDDRTSSTSYSPLVVFYICTGPVVLQLVIVLEWAVFESPTQLMLAEFDEVTEWRCTPGYTFEQRLFHSMVLNIFMIVFSLVCSMLTVRNVESRQNVLACIVALVTGLVLYLILPLIGFSVRDQVFASVLLVFAVFNVLIPYLPSAFRLRRRRRASGAIVQENPCWTGESLTDKEMQIAQNQGFWLNPHVTTMSQRSPMKPIAPHPMHSIAEFVVGPPPPRHESIAYRQPISMGD